MRRSESVESHSLTMRLVSYNAKYIALIVASYIKSTVASQNAAQLNEQLKELKKTYPRKSEVIEEAETMIGDLTREARAFAAKAKEIEDAVYDLKAVNPNKKAEIDDRTPEDLLDIIETEGLEIAEALSLLKNASFQKS